MDDFDFGFSSTSYDDLHAESNNTIESLTKSLNSYKNKVDDMYSAILPLLQNLLKDADNSPIINWPNRREKIESFIEKLNEIKNGE